MDNEIFLSIKALKVIPIKRSFDFKTLTGYARNEKLQIITYHNGKANYYSTKERKFKRIKKYDLLSD